MIFNDNIQNGMRMKSVYSFLLSCNGHHENFLMLFLTLLFNMKISTIDQLLPLVSFRFMFLKTKTYSRC